MCNVHGIMAIGKVSVMWSGSICTMYKFTLPHGVWYIPGIPTHRLLYYPHNTILPIRMGNIVWVVLCGNPCVGISAGHADFFGSAWRCVSMRLMRMRTAPLFMRIYMHIMSINAIYAFISACGLCA